MASNREIYDDTIEDKLDLGGNLHATWLPGKELSVGEVGRFEDDVFVARGRLDDPDRNVEFELADPASLGHDLNYATEGSVEILAKAKGETDAQFSAIAKASAGAKFTFSREQAVAVSFRQLREERVKSEKQLAENIVSAYNDGERMQMEDVVITHVLRAGWGVALMSAESGAEVEVKVDVDIGKGPIKVGDVKGETSVQREEKTVFADAMPGGATPAFRAVRLTTKGVFLWVRPGIEPTDDRFVEAREPMAEVS